MCVVVGWSRSEFNGVDNTVLQSVLGSDDLQHALLREMTCHGALHDLFLCIFYTFSLTAKSSVSSFSLCACHPHDKNIPKGLIEYALRRDAGIQA